MHSNLFHSPIECPFFSMLLLSPSNPIKLTCSLKNFQLWKNGFRPKNRFLTAHLRQFFLAASQVAETAAQLPNMEANRSRNVLVNSHALLVKYLETFESKSSELDSTLANATKAVSDAIRLGLRCDGLLQIAAIQNLQKHANTQPLFDLLSIFTKGGSRDLAQLAKQHGTQLFEKFGLEESDVVNKLRLLTLCSLANEAPKQPAVFHLSALVEQLDVNDVDEVEDVIIEATTTGMVDAKLDEDQGTVVLNARRFAT
eukprot:GABV01001767.1.p1 GENE.GABV01001767.1~~GABV01001767.1.p1  ORF type:complete len:256 (-),score=71.69 GABV01001767.1:25-792(-)